MKTIIIILTGVLFQTLIAFGQETRIINTKDLIQVSKAYGLDSAVQLSYGFPIYLIDKKLSKKLIEDVLTNIPSNTIDNFLYDYAQNVNDDKNISKILTKYYNPIIYEVENLQPDHLGFFPSISMDMLITFIKNKSSETESFLIDYYNEWNKKSEYYKEDYITGLNISDSFENLKSTTPYEQCNLFCFRILLALKSMKSNFFDTIKLENHRKYLKENWNQSIYSIISYDRKEYLDKEFLKTIKLSTIYNSLGEINYNKEVEFNNILLNYNNPFCQKIIVYNENIGYLNLSCNGDYMTIELKLEDNYLKVYLISSGIYD